MQNCPEQCLGTGQYFDNSPKSYNLPHPHPDPPLEMEGENQEHFYLS